MKLKILFVIALCFSVFVSPAGLSAQVRPVNDYGALGLARLLKQLQTTASVMMIGAHPDDEDSALLAYLARGENARTAYLSLTRGDGGQNIIGPELFESLGVIRTEELLQARRLDGAEQYFARAFDYGFSKTLDEAKSKWPEEVIKCDAVRAIRLFRPLVVISRFTGTPADGHGQHQYAGYITPKAVAAAADPSQCTDAGEPWKVLKFYVEQSFSDNAQPTLKINTGQYDPVLGRTYFEIAMEGRSLHRSQGEGRIEFHGDSFSGLNLVGAAKDIREKEIFDGIDTALSGLPALTANSEDVFATQMQLLTKDLDHVVGTASLLHPSGSVTGLVELVKNAEKAELSTTNTASRFRLWEFEQKAKGALKIAAGIRINVLADQEIPVAGDKFLVAVKTYIPSISYGQPGEISLSAQPGWEVTKTNVPEKNSPGFTTRENSDSAAVYEVAVQRAYAPTAPYWLRSPRRGDLFSWEAASSPTLPFDSPQMVARVEIRFAEKVVLFDQPVQYRFADPSRGEIRREVNVVPALSVAMDRDLLVVPVSNIAQIRRVVVSVTNNASREQSGNISLNVAVDPQWKVAAPNGSTFILKTKGAKASISFDITIPAKMPIGSVPIRASAEVGEARYALTMNVVAYPHIQTHRFYTPADSMIETLDLKTAPANIGYVMGSGDEVPDAITQMGMKVTMLGESDLASGDLSKFDTIVVGIRASETRPDLVANNARLLDYVRGGGNVVIQYQRFAWTGLAPYKVDIQDKQGTTAGSIARVVDENAPVRILDPTNPIFNIPNKITDDDFKGWVQERNAYNLVTFDSQYTPLLESHDAGEQENKGGLVIAKVGKGNWVYCSYSFFRQLPAGVPGAYRLFANLLSLPRAK